MTRSLNSGTRQALSKSLVNRDGPVARLIRRSICSAASFLTAGSRLLFPPRCAHCDVGLPPEQEQDRLCADCCCLLGPEVWPCCPRCGAVRRSDGEAPDRCGLCKRTPLKFDSVIPLGAYVGVLGQVVLRMKRPHEESLSAAMGLLLARRRATQLADLRPDLIVPVPMYWARRIRRGVNSPEILANSLGKALGSAVRRRVLTRRRNTLPQASLSPRRRFKNVHGAFRVRARYNLDGMRVLLVDDILTTGATCSEAARILKRAGAAVVAAAVIARAQGPDST